MILPEQVVNADAHDEEGSRGETGQYGVRELHAHIGVQNQCEEILHLGPPVAQHVTDRLLHERVGDQDPKGRQVRTDSDHPHDCRV